MGKIFVIIQREYLSRVRTRGFVVLTLLLPATLVAIAYARVALVGGGSARSTRIAVVDMSHRLYPDLDTALSAPDDGQPSPFHLTQVDATPASLPAVRGQLRAQVLANTLDAYLVIPADVLDSRAAEFHARNVANIDQNALLRGRLRDAVTHSRLVAAGIPATQIPDLLNGFDLQQSKIDAHGDRADKGQTVAVAWTLVILLYITLMLYGVIVMKSVTEEKTTRISEILLSSVDAFSLMLGKIFGIAAVALTQYLIWGLMFALVAAYGLVVSGADLGKMLPHIGAGLLVSFILFFLLGFLVFASLFAAVGALVSSDQEAQQSQAPITMLLLFAYLCAVFVMNNPAAPLSTVLSMIPFFAPILMTVRIAVSNPPLWQIAASMLICVATLLALTKITAKIYRVGLLMTGKRPNLPELLRWLKYA